MADNAIWSDMDGGEALGPTKGLIVRFFRGTKRNVFKSTADGYPQDIAVDYVRIGQVGERDDVVHEVNLIQADKRWPDQWRAYQEGREQVSDGMPLDMLFPGNPEVVSTLKLNHIHTIEQLAGITDTNKFSFALVWQQKAMKFLDARKEDAMPAMEAKMAALLAQVEALKTASEQKPKRGRPPSVKTPERELAHE
jgi:hypothetical protein